METKVERAKDRLNVARETLAEAQALIAIESWRGAINRLYYASFYTVSDYLITIDEEAATHKGTKHKFNQHLAGTQLVNRSVAKAFNQLATVRNDTDYTDFSTLSGNKTIEFERSVISLIKTVEKLIA